MVTENSLSNLNPRNRYQGKVRVNLSLLPETVETLKSSGNASQKIDELVSQSLSDDAHKLKKSDDAHKLKNGIEMILESHGKAVKGYRANAFSQGIRDLKSLLADLD